MTKWLSVPALIMASSGMAQASEFHNFGFIGAGVKVEQSAIDTEAHLGFQPTAFYNGDYGFLDGTLLNLSPIQYFGVSAHYRAPTANNEDSIPSGIKERDGAIEAGLTLGTVGARVSYLKDISDTHDGYEIRGHVGYAFTGFALPQLTVAPFAEMSYYDQKLSQHLYGISAQESAASSLNTHDSDATMVYRAGAVILYPITEQWLFDSKLEFSHSDSTSPLIQNDLSWSMFVGAAYRFSF